MGQCPARAGRNVPWPGACRGLLLGCAVLGRFGAKSPATQPSSGANDDRNPERDVLEDYIIIASAAQHRTAQQNPDDYLTNPFSMRELLAHVGALLRRVELLRDHSAPG